MLRGLRSRYEEYHQVIISDAAIDAAVRLSVRYVNDRFLPDKAIDLIDEASARFRMNRVVRKGNNQKKLEAKADKLYDEREQGLIDGDMELVMKIREQEKELEEQFQKEKKKAARKGKKADRTITENHIAEIVAKWTHIPVQQLAEAEDCYENKCGRARGDQGFLRKETGRVTLWKGTWPEGVRGAAYASGKKKVAGTPDHR